jgi:CAAX prenyl protease-like protein
MIEKKFFKNLEKIISAVTAGDYSSGKELERLLDKNRHSEEIVDFAESLNLMTIILEAKEMGLEKTISELRAKSNELEESIAKRQLFSTIFTSLFISVTIFIFFLFLIQGLSIKSDYSARVVEVIFFITTMIIVKRSALPLSSFGVTTKEAHQSISAMLPGTLIICGFLVVLKYYLIIHHIQGFDGPLIIVSNVNFLLFLYIGIVFIQEFLSRGVVQTVIEHVSIGENKKFWSIMTTSCLFGIVHMQISVVFALISLGLGVYWGFVYFKHRTLIGVSISHCFIGGFAYILGFWDALVKL